MGVTTSSPITVCLVGPVNEHLQCYSKDQKCPEAPRNMKVIQVSDFKNSSLIRTSKKLNDFDDVGFVTLLLTTT